jgi:hypothetical protein
MDPPANRAASLRAYPNISTAARMLGVATSTLSRRGDLASEARGERDQVLAPAEVMRLAAVYRKNSLNDVAHDLIELARESSAEDAGRVEGEVEAFFERGAVPAERQEEFLATARLLLPAKLYSEVESSLTETDERLPSAVAGHHPLPKD